MMYQHSALAHVPDDAAKDDEDVVHIEIGHDLVGLALVGAHGLAHQGDVRVVPRVVVHQRGPVCHAGYLVAVVPPAHDGRILVGVLPKPVVGLAEVVQDVAAAVRTVRSLIKTQNHQEKKNLKSTIPTYQHDGR